MLPAPGSGSVHGLTFDGTHLFVADQGSNTIYTMVPEPGPLGVAPGRTRSGEGDCREKATKDV